MMKTTIAAMKNTNIPCVTVVKVAATSLDSDMSKTESVSNVEGRRFNDHIGPTARSERLVLTEVKAETPKSSEENQWGCEVCGLDEWCGTDGCPLDPQ